MNSYLKSRAFLISKVLVFLILLTTSIGCSSQTSSTNGQTSMTSEVSSPISTILTTLISTSTSTTTVTSVPVILSSISVEPIKPEILESGVTQQFKAIGSYSDGTTKDITTQVDWQSSDETIATITTAGEALGVARTNLSDPIPQIGISLTANAMVSATLNGISSAPVNLTVVKAPVKQLSPLDALVKGIFFADWAAIGPLPSPPSTLGPLPPPPASTTNPPPYQGLYPAPVADQSLMNLAATGANWIGLNIVCEQKTIASTTIVRGPPRTASDDELIRMIDLAHNLGIRVMLRPQVALSTEDPTHWSGNIGSAFTNETQWNEWFASYRDFIDYYAVFSQKTGVDMLCLGVEMGGVTHREQDWRRIIQEVRERYEGPLTYSSLSSSSGPNTPFPHGEENRIEWWDAVDYIGVSAYYCLTNKNNPTVAEIKAAWIDRGHLALLENLSNKFDKPIIFTEIGYESRDGTNIQPAHGILTEATFDLQEQADCYQAVMEVMFAQPWFKGMFWFQWLARAQSPTTNPIGGTSFMPWGKPAEEVLKDFYLQ